ncbi:hypothetical protein NQD34_017544 [Periophthalmus magnuspinnatus]|uniref:urotensin 1 n=1 Tax=Periophthalmus magnuspinnatus TaxID=409849 RepID=UPI0022C28149|nr:urotensin 1 [Periophthalmus magnuspinnatus]KAJ0026544.1 hypothetical protein NQD34_017544 [Periophthalmus magnuspinnatus]
MKPASLLLFLVSSILVSSPLSLSSAPLSYSSSSPPLLLSVLDSPLALHLLRLLNKRQYPPMVRLLAPGPPSAALETGDSGEAFREGLGKSRRNEPPLSIDLTFHLLRNMIHMAKLESQREQALINRKVMDEVGK